MGRAMLLAPDRESLNDGRNMPLYLSGGRRDGELFFGFDHGGAEDDAWQITLMLDDIDGDEALEKRLRRFMSWLW